MKYIYLTGLLLATIIQTAWAQQELTLHNMSSIFQSAHTNPAMQHKHKVIISLASSYQINAKNTGFTYNQVLAQVETDETGQRVLDLGQLADQLKLNGKDYVHTSASLDVFGLSFKSGKNRFSLNVTEHMQARLGYSDAILNLAVNGNVPGSTINLDGYTFNGTHYREIGLGYNRKILEDDKLIVGGRVKSLFGMSNVRTVRSDVGLTTAEENDLYEITANADILVRTSGIEMLEEGETDYITNMDNKGLGVDLGASYRYSDKWTFSASVINLGYINWKKGVTNYESKGEYVFSGIDNDELFNGNFDFDATEVLDSITSIFEFDETEGKYTTSLPTQVYLSGFYQLAHKTTASATLYSDFVGGFRKGMSLGVTQTVGRWFQASATYTMHARSYNNLGLGIAVGTGFQLYAVTDNIISLMQPGNAKLVNMRAGFNFLF